MGSKKREWENNTWPKEAPVIRTRGRSNVKRCDSCGYYRPITEGKICVRCKDFEVNYVKKPKIELTIPKPRQLEEITTPNSHSEDAGEIISFVVFILFLWWAFTIYAALIWIGFSALIMGAIWIKNKMFARA